MRHKRWILVAVVLFIGLNLLLLVLDRSGKVDRIAYLTDWTMTTKADMYVKLNKEGVLDYTDEQHVYFNKQIGTFGEFLVAKGDTVNKGDPLYTYNVQNYAETKKQLENEAAELDEEIAVIEEAINKMRSYQISEQTTLRFSFGEDNETVELPSDSSEAEMLKEQFIIDKEKERKHRIGKQRNVQAQIAELQAGGETVTVESPYSGKITMVSETLDNPIVTIRTADLHVKGELTEEQRTKVKEGMPVAIWLNNQAQTVQGTVEYISDAPETIAVNKKSLYPFSVAFTDKTKAESWLAGYHVSMDIQLDSSIDATALKADTINKKSVWKLTPSGKLMKQPILTGIYMEDLAEVKDGLEVGDWIAIGPEKHFRDGAAFITPLHFHTLNWKGIAKTGNWKKNIITGILSR